MGSKNNITVNDKVQLLKSFNNYGQEICQFIVIDNICA
jgi:hypothetical protein